MVGVIHLKAFISEGREDILAGEFVFLSQRGFFRILIDMLQVLESFPVERDVKQSRKWERRAQNFWLVRKAPLLQLLCMYSRLGMLPHLATLCYPTQTPTSEPDGILSFPRPLSGIGRYDGFQRRISSEPCQVVVSNAIGYNPPPTASFASE